MSEVEIVEQIWVSTTEAAEITGYNSGYLKQLANKIRKQPESQRLIKVRNRSNRHELWLPDLIAYINTPQRGPQPKRTDKTKI